MYTQNMLTKLPISLILCLLLAVAPTLTFAQKNSGTSEAATAIDYTKTNYNKVEDVVYLKNGWIIRGRIQYYDATTKVRIVTADRNEFVFYADEIDRIVQEPRKRKLEQPAMDRGLYVGMNVAFGTGRGPFGGTANASGLQWTVGTMLTPRIGTGVSAGIDWYNGQRLVPFTAEGRYLLFKNHRNQPFVRAYGGYSPPWLANNDWLTSFGGGTGGFDVGAVTRFSEYMALSITMGMAYQREKIEYQDWQWGGTVTEINHYQRLWLRIGIVF